MKFTEIQQYIAERITADAFFQPLGIVARKGFTARVEADGDLEEEFRADIEQHGFVLVVGMTQVDAVDMTRSGRAFMKARVDVDIVENPKINRSDAGLDIDPNTLAFEVMQALIAHTEINPYPEKNFSVEHDERMALYIHRVSFAVDTISTGRS